MLEYPSEISSFTMNGRISRFFIQLFDTSFCKFGTDSIEDVGIIDKKKLLCFDLQNLNLKKEICNAVIINDIIQVLMQ